MSDNKSNPPNDGSSTVDERFVRDMYEQVTDLTERVQELEETNSDLSEQNQQLSDDVQTLKKKVTRLEEENEELTEQVSQQEEQISTLQEQMNAMNSRADVLYEQIEETQEDITDQAFHAENRLADITKRVAGIETELGLEEWETASSISPNACALERFQSMPDDRRDSELKAPVARATLVWENFDDWSSPTHKGRVIRSGELRKLLKAKTGEKLAWTQVYRVMEEFADNTTNQYQYIESDDDRSAFGKALVRVRDFEGNNQATNSGHDDYQSC